jgi:hypothetical protein
MNIAICICGEPRNKEIGAKSIKKFREEIKKYDNIKLDVFYHIWDHVTKRQRNHKSQEPFVEYVTKNELDDLFEPTVGILADKKEMDQEIEYIWEYVCNLNEPNPRYDTIDILRNQIYYSNTPGYSQLHSLCQNQLKRIEYEEKNNINYDLIIKTRTDVEFKCTPTFDHIKKIAENPNFQEQIFLPKIEVWSVKHETLIIPEFSLFYGNSNTLNKNIWVKYPQKIVPDLYYYKGGPHLSVTNDHTLFMNLLLKNAKVKIHGDLHNALHYKLHQMPTYYKEQKRKYSHY